MKEIKNGDIVSRKSYNNDIMFCVKKIIKIDRERKIAIFYSEKYNKEMIEKKLLKNGKNYKN